MKNGCRTSKLKEQEALLTSHHCTQRMFAERTVIKKMRQEIIQPISVMRITIQ